MDEIKNFNLNFGPQHPAAHGVLRLVLQLNGERIVKSDAHIGLLHRGTEKLVEQKNVAQTVPYLDRLDYVSMFCNEHVYAQVIEKNINSQNSAKTQNQRVILLEITRILNHLMCLTTHVMDVGALTPFLLGFEEREKIMGVYENVSGARMHAAVITPNKKIGLLEEDSLENIQDFCKDFQCRVSEIDSFLGDNRIIKQRLSNVGYVDEKTATAFSMTGPTLRSTGAPVDLRITDPYEKYKDNRFKMITSYWGDTYSRYFLRIEEIKESFLIIANALKALEEYKNHNKEFSWEVSEKTGALSIKIKMGMEEIILHFDENADGTNELKEGECFLAVESPKGILGVFLSTTIQKEVERMKFRTPGFSHMQAYQTTIPMFSLSDAVTILGSYDVVFGEVDR